jgi:hypothetical protein
MKKRILFLASLALVLGFSACNKDDVQVNNDNSTVNNESVVFITDQEVLSERIEMVNIPVNFQNKSTDALEYTWVANMNPSVINGSTLSAAAVDGYGDFIYVGYHAAGTPVAGEIAVLSLEDPDNLEMVQSVQFQNKEFNDVEVKSNVSKLFAAGVATTDMSGVSVGDNNAMALAYDINPATGALSDLDWENYLAGYSANSITYVANQTVWVSKGSQGGLTVFRDYDLNHIKIDMEVSNAKHFDATGDWGALVYGVGFNESNLVVWDMTNLYDPMTTYTIPYDVTPQGKNGVDINGDYAYLAMGNDGIVKVDLTNGNVVNNFDYDNGGKCNGVAVDWRYVYAAYGSDGLFVLDKETFEVIGNWDFNGSCNYVKKVGDYLYLANGNDDGLIILKKD